MAINKELGQKDEEAVLKVQSGEIEFFELLVSRYDDKIKRYGRKFLAGYEDIEDIVQQIFLKAYINIQSFDPSKKFSSWLYRIAHNEFINAIKKKKREPLPFFDPDSIFPHPLSRDRADKNVREKEVIDMANKCLDVLKPGYREVVILYYLEEFSYREIADVLRIPISTVGIRIKRAKKIMSQFMEKYGQQ